jgi:hypothetical protein
MDRVHVEGKGVSSNARGDSGGQTKPTKVSNTSADKGKGDDNKASMDASKWWEAKERTAVSKKHRRKTNWR